MFCKVKSQRGLCYVQTKSDEIFPREVEVQTRVVAIDATFFRVARFGRFGRRDVHPSLKYFNFEAIISQLGPISSRVAPRVSPLLNQNKMEDQRIVADNTSYEYRNHR